MRLQQKKPNWFCVEEGEEESIEMDPIPPSKFTHSICSAPPPQETESQSQNMKKFKTCKTDELPQKGKPSFFLRRHTTNAATTSSLSSRSNENPHGYLFQFSNQIDQMGIDLPKENWSKKPKQSKQSKQFWLAQWFKASRAFIKSLFTSTGCSHNSSAIDANKAENNKSMCQEFQKNKPGRSFSVTRRIENDMVDGNRRRVSFSGDIQRHFAPKASTLSNSEVESSIEDAIAHCKRSQL